MSNLFTKRGFIALSCIVLATGILSGCAAICSSRHQKISFQTSTPDAKVKFLNSDVSKGKKVKVDKYKYYYTASVEKKGYKSMNYAFQINKRSATYAFTALNILIPIYGWFYGFPIDAMTPKTRKFDKTQKIPALTPYESRKNDEKYLLINNTAFDAKGTDITSHDYLSINRFKSGNHKDSRATKKENRSDEREDIKVDNTIFTSALNGTLKDMGFVDTTDKVFPNINNSLYLNATVKKITLHYINSRSGKRTLKASSRYNMTKYLPNLLFSIEMEVEWDVLDYYKQKVYTTNTDKKSDLFVISYSKNHKDYHDDLTSAIKNNMETSVIEVRKQLKDKGYLSISNIKETPLPAITISKPVADPNKRMNDFMNSSVTVKVDDGHGSGIVISQDGYIITAYHVVAGAKKIEVMINDTTTVTAEVVRKNTEADLALLKVAKTGLSPLVLSQVPEPEVGIDVWAIGTPENLALGKSVAKGILSGIRKANDVSYLQTDVSVNHGNSGGALITKDGTVLGVITSKLVGVGVEGLGFAISTKEIFNRLKVQYE